MNHTRFRIAVTSVATASLVLIFAAANSTTEVDGQPSAWSDNVGAADTPDDIYLSAVSDEIPDAADDDLLLAGHVACDSFEDSVMPVDENYASGVIIGLTVTWPEWTTYQAGYLVGAAIQTWCPYFGYLGE